jgi:hypothetical protein
LCRKAFFGDSHTNSTGDALAQQTGGYFNASVLFDFGMARANRSDFPKRF